MTPRSLTIVLPAHNEDARLAPGGDEARSLAYGRRESAGTVVAGGAVLLPSVLVGDMVPLIEAAVPA